jgi:hypothetical protein
MHFLDLRSLLALARCDRRSLAAASTDFACKHTLVHVKAGNGVIAANPARSRVLGHVDVLLDWRSGPNISSDLAIYLVRSFLRIRMLKNTHLHGWKAAFMEPALASVTHLEVTLSTRLDTIPADVDALVVHLQRIESLTINCNGSGYTCGTLAAIARLPRLCHLELNKFEDGFLASELNACTTLRSLDLLNRKNGVLQPLLCCTGARVLEKISVGHANDDHTVDWSVIAHNLVSVRELEVCETTNWRLSELFMETTAFPVLERLVIYPYGDWMRMPDVELLTGAMHLRPTLSICINLCSKRIESADIARVIYAPVAAAYPDRFTFRGNS